MSHTAKMISRYGISVNDQTYSMQLVVHGGYLKKQLIAWAQVRSDA